MKKFPIIFFLPLFVFSCQSFDIVKRPKVSIEKCDIDSLTLRDITFLFDIGIENPYPSGLKLDDIFTGKKVKPVIDPSILDKTFGVDFDIRLRNNTKSRILFDSLEYQFFLDGNQLITGETKNIKNTANESTIKISNNFKSSELSKNILNIFSRKHSAFFLKGFTILNLPDYVAKNSVKLSFDEKGLVQLQ